MTVAVRRLQARDDVGTAAQLLTAFFAEEGFETAPTTVERHVGEMAKLDICGLFQADADGEAVGVATASLEFGIEYGWSAEMGDLYVVPSWRGRGVAGQLIDALEAFLIARGAAGYQVSVTQQAEERHRLSRYYRMRGFRDDGRRLLFKRLR
jgi:GNAT superfamily N-acetyltransferase